MSIELIQFLVPFTKYPYRGEEVACPICGSKQYRSIATLDRRFKRLTTVGCEHCGFLYTNPLPTDQELQHYYTHLYRLDYQGASRAPKEIHLRKRVREAEVRINFLKHFLKPASRTLDFGCGSGELVSGLAALGHDARGFEPGESYGNYARTKLGERIQVAGWQQVQYDDGFDLVTCCHVLEHLRNPLDALDQMSKWARPNGLIYIEVPDMEELVKQKGFRAFHFAHLMGFNRYTLLLAGAKAGLKPKAIVSPTGIIFEHRLPTDPNLEQEYSSQGKALLAHSRKLR